MITLATESVAGVLAEIIPLLVQHYEEIAWKKDKIPFDPDYNLYTELEQRGVLKIFTAREEGRLIGYAIFLVSPNLHYRSVIVGKNDLFYVEPSRRGVYIGKKLITYAELELKKCGVNVIDLHIKTSHNWVNLAVRWGYEHTESNVQKWIGD